MLALLGTLGEWDLAELTRVVGLWPGAPGHIKAAVLLLLGGRGRRE